MARNTILFGGTDPGRFCPTYIIFCESFIPHYCQPKQDQKFDRRDVYIITQNALADGTYLDYLRAQYFPSRLIRRSSASCSSYRRRPGRRWHTEQSWPPDGGGSGAVWRFQGSADAWKRFVNMLNYTLDVPFTKWGAYVEKYRRAEGVYPPKEIYIPSPEDSQNCFQSYDRGRCAPATVRPA